MSQQSLADTLIGWAIYAIKTFATLPFNLQIEPFVSGDVAQSERLVIKVEIGEQYLEADQGFNGTMTLTYKTVERNADIANDKWAKIEAAFFAGLQTTGSIARFNQLFQRLCFLTEQAQTTIDNTTNFRHYTRTLPLQVKQL